MKEAVRSTALVPPQKKPSLQTSWMLRAPASGTGLRNAGCVVDGTPSALMPSRRDPYHEDTYTQGAKFCIEI